MGRWMVVLAWMPVAAAAQDEYARMAGLMGEVLEGCLGNSATTAGDLDCAELVSGVCIGAGPGGGTTYGLNSCSALSYRLWDDELNRLWPELRAAVAAEEAEALLAQQRAWIAERDLFCEAAGAEMGGGSAVTFTINSCLAQRTAERVAEFRERLGR